MGIVASQTPVSWGRNYKFAHFCTMAKHKTQKLIIIKQLMIRAQVLVYEWGGA